MLINCGPQNDLREFNLVLPSYNNHSLKEKLLLKTNFIRQNYKIGILVSGGLDSALLYYLLLLENQNSGKMFQITPYTILRKEGSKYYASKVINHIHGLLGLPKIELNIVGNPNLEEIVQVESGIKEILEKDDFVYVGIIESRPEHSLNWKRFTFKETARRKYPMLNLQKSHIIDLIYKLHLESVIPFTHSCAVNEINPCLQCNGCNERRWGFEELGLNPI